MQIVRNEKAENSPVIISANHQIGAMGGVTAKSPNIDAASTATPPATAKARAPRKRCASQPKTGSCTTSNRRSANKTPASAVSPTPNSST